MPADEYDAAQERGEARTRGGDRTGKLLDEKFGPKDVGLDDNQLLATMQRFSAFQSRRLLTG
jgi:hypothetical protein